MAAENMLKHHECYNSPYSGIDFMIESCNIDLIPITIENQKLMGMFGDDGNGHRFIAYNQNMIPARILFTKAHELGHFVLEHKLNSDILIDQKDEPKEPQETEANVFASALLMPKERVLSVVKSAFDDLKIQFIDSEDYYSVLNQNEKDYLIECMKNSFHTSKQAIENRLKNISH